MLEFRFIGGENGYKIAEDMRKKVFADELGMSEYRDELEELSYHFIGYEKTMQIGISRLTQLDENNFNVAFVAVKEDYRRQFVGDLIMRALADKAKSLGGTAIYIETPVRVKAFFEFEGYEPYGDGFEKDNIPYIRMKKDLTKVQHSCGGCGK